MISGAKLWLPLTVIYLFIGGPLAWALPVHVLRFVPAGPTVGCKAVFWHDTLTFYNPSSSTVTVRVLGISNGGPFRSDPPSFMIPGGTVVDADVALHGAWSPKNGDPIWIMHLDIPDGVMMESRNEIRVGDVCIAENPVISAGKISLPIFRELVPANEPQVHLGTDVGSRDAHINIGIYNQGAVTANAHVEVRRACDNTVVDSRDVTVPPDAMTQFAGLAKGKDSGCGA